MNPLGIGIDVVDVARVARLLQQHGERALPRLLTDAERDYCLSMAVPARHIAVRLAAKEAAFKAFHSAGARGMLGWLEIEVERHPHGEPALVLHGRALGFADQLHVSRALVSLSHSDTQGAAIVLLLG
jgi:holo-[acyl-carrier protein] synthase